MKIFPKESAATENRPAAAKGKATSKAAKESVRKKEALPAKKDISAAEIREKLAARVETSDAAKNMAIKNSKPLGAGFMNDEAKPAPIIAKAPAEEGAEAVSGEVKSPNTKDFVLNSDIAKNDPTDSNTQEKLKMALSKGAFNFNPKERDALEKILANQ